jgi:putative DNA primase/helicase
MTGYGIALLPQHAGLLTASAITPEVARARGYRSVDTKAHLESIGVAKAGRNVPGLLVPLHDKHGEVWGFQYRPDVPRLNGTGKPIKYETPVKQRNGIDVPPGVGPLLDNPTVPLFITEGTRKADAAACAGLACVSLSGVWSWLGTNPSGGKTALADWHDIALNGRPVLLAFDSDVMIKPDVRKALERLAGYLTSKGAKIGYLHLPHGGDGKTGLDDYLAAHTVDELWTLVRLDPPEVDDAQARESAPQVATDDDQGDLANARCLVAKFGDQLRYVVPWRKWLCWDGARWAPDDTGQAWRYAKKMADTLPRRTAKGGPARAQTAPGLGAMLQLAGTEPGIAVAPSALDPDPYLLNVRNGTLDLRTGQLRPHDRADLLTKVAGASYDPRAAAPEFVTFLVRIQPDPAMMEFFARLFGHAVLGKVVEHVLAIFYGVGANGKTTLVEAVTGALGDYARPVDPGLLIDRGEVHPTGTAALFGLRLAVTHELDAGRRLAEATVKRLTGGDKITARRMREDFWDFTPSHSLIMHTNHKPIVRGTDEGIWRRLRFVPFNVVIPEHERDPKLPDRLALEADGILTWIVAGYRQWQNRGLAAPEQVATATATFRGESDMLGLFIAERCRLNAGPHATVQSSHLFASWCEWCRRENVDAGTQTAFSHELTDRGYDKKKDGLGRMVWTGIDLYADEADK